MYTLVRLMLTSIFSLVSLILGMAIGVLAFVFKLVWFRFFAPTPDAMGAYVIDGDTIAVGGQVRVRLFGIDAPEMDQPGGVDAKHHLEALIAGRPVRVRVRATDKYGRTVAQVFNSEGEDVGRAMVANGYARAYTSFTRAYAHDERVAKWRKNGLWSQGALSIHPQAWRQSRR